MEGRSSTAPARPGVAGDVAIERRPHRRDRHRPVRATASIDATGCVVAPGFIDIHTHYDAQVFWDPALTPSCFHGVTTVVAGNCGFSIAPTPPERPRRSSPARWRRSRTWTSTSLAAGIPWDFETFPEYLGVGRARAARVLNFAAYIGHTAAAHLRDGRRGLRAARPRPTRSTGWPASSREAMDAGAAGFATSFAITHLGADGQPIPSRWADRAELEALFRAVGRRAAAASSAINGVSDELHFDEIYDLQRELGVPFTCTAAADHARPARTSRRSTMHREGMEQGRRGVAAGVAPPADVLDDHGRAVHAQHQPGLRRADGRHARRPLARPTPTRRGAQRVRDALGRPGRRAAPAAVGDLRDDGVDRPPRARRRSASSTSPPSAASTRSTCCSTSPSTSRRCATSAVKAVARQRRRGRRARRCSSEDGCTLGLSDAGAHVGQLCDAPLATDLLGNWVREQGRAHRGAGRAQAHPGAGRPVRLRRPRRARARATPPTSSCSTPTPSRPARCAGSTTSRPAPSASPPTSPTGMRHLLVNGTPVIVDGELRDAAVDRPPRPARAPRRPLRIRFLTTLRGLRPPKSSRTGDVAARRVQLARAAAAGLLALVLDEVDEHVVAERLGRREERPAAVDLGQPLDERREVARWRRA